MRSWNKHLFELGMLTLLLLWGASRVHAGDSPHRFVVYGDTRDGHTMHRKIVADILAQKPEWVIHTGDLVAHGGDDDLWKIFDSITGGLRKKVPFYTARGNHDVGGDGYVNHMTAPIASGSRLYYTFDRAECHFVSLDCYSAYNSDSDQYRWLEKDLAAHQKSRFRIVYFHEPPYSIGAHGSNFTIRNALCPLFKKYHVQLVLNGHDHNYYRTKRDGIAYIVTGGGGAPLYDCNPKKGAIEGDKWEKVNNYVVCDIAGDALRLTAYRSDNSKIDSFVVKSK